MIDYNNPNEYWQHNPMMQDPNIDPEDAMKSGCFVCLSYLIAFAVGVLLCALLGSCTTTQYVPVIEHKTDTVIQTKVQKDSIWLHDSIYVHEWTKGDTIFVESRKWLTKYVDHEVHDTLYQSKTDSIPVPYPVIKEVPRKRTTTDWVLTITGLIAILGVIVWVANKVRRFLPGM